MRCVMAPDAVADAAGAGTAGGFCCSSTHKRTTGSCISCSSCCTCAGGALAGGVDCARAGRLPAKTPSKMATPYSGPAHLRLFKCLGIMHNRPSSMELAAGAPPCAKCRCVPSPPPTPARDDPGWPRRPPPDPHQIQVLRPSFIPARGAEVTLRDSHSGAYASTSPFRIA
jgi:hypothetical protein